MRDVVQTYRRARHRDDSELTVLDEANVAKALGRPNGEVHDTVRLLIDCAIEHQRDWLYKFKR
jgi:hypothetical protein